MLYALGAVVIGVTAGFQYIVKANQVAFDISIRIGDGIAHASLCSQVYYYFRLVVGKDFIYQRFVGQVAFDEGPLGFAVFGSAGSNLLQTVFLDGYIVVVFMLSRPMICTGDRERSSSRTRLLPMKPAAPVTKIVCMIYISPYTSIIVCYAILYYY